MATHPNTECVAATGKAGSGRWLEWASFGLDVVIFISINIRIRKHARSIYPEIIRCYLHNGSKSQNK